MGFKLVDHLVGYDIYGHQVGINYRGDNFYRTKLGTFFTLVTYVLIIFNVLSSIQAFYDGSRD